MNFGKALEALKQGYAVKLPHWKGYWKKEDNTIKMYCKDGSVLDIRETGDVFYTFRNIASEEWEVVEDCNIDLNVHTFTFGEAIRHLKAGKKVARKGWNGKGMFLCLSVGYDIIVEELANRNFSDYYWKNPNDGIVHINSHIDMKAADDSLVIGWLASQTDMLADDWILVE